MDELNIYFSLFYLTDKMDDLAVFKYFVQHTLIVDTTRVRYIIINFVDTFTTLLSYSEKEIYYFVKENNQANITRTANKKVLIPQNAILELNSVLFELNDW